MKLNFVSLLALVAMPMAHASSVDTCDMQQPCISWTMAKFDESTCGLTGDCTVEVCMTVDENALGCTKSGLFSHMCDQTDAAGCAAWTDDTGLVPVMSGDGDVGDCFLDTGAGATGQVSGKCTEFSKITMCQEGLPGTTLYWILKDGSDTTDGDVGVYNFMDDVAGGTGCPYKVTCENNLQQCAGKTQQLLMERTWMFEIPEVTVTTDCDICSSPQTEAPVPATEAPVPATDPPVPEASPSGTLGDPHCKEPFGTSF
jgi:hypothetical protein